MSGFERLGDALSRKEIDRNDNILEFFDLCRSTIKKLSSVDVESLTYKHDTLGVTVGSSIEATEVRLRHIQIERTLAKRSGRKIKRLVVRVL